MAFLFVFALFGAKNSVVKMEILIGQRSYWKKNVFCRCNSISDLGLIIEGVWLKGIGGGYLLIDGASV